MKVSNPNAQGPDPAVMEAISRLKQTELDPLEEVMFQSWASANQLDGEAADGPDFRAIYKQTGGKVLPPGELKRMSEKQSAIQTLMQAQEAHEAASPIKALMGDEGLDPGTMDQGTAPQQASSGDNIVWGT